MRASLAAYGSSGSEGAAAPGAGTAAPSSGPWAASAGAVVAAPGPAWFRGRAGGGAVLRLRSPCGEGGIVVEIHVWRVGGLGDSLPCRELRAVADIGLFSLG